MTGTDLVVRWERHRRIRLAVFAYSYEIANDPLVSDAEYDSLSSQINTSISTGNDNLDDFFMEHFSPYTGQWIHKHPDLERIGQLYLEYKSRKQDGAET